MATKRLTAEIVNKMQAGEVIWDAEVRGFGVRHRGRDPHYLIKTRIAGKQRILTIGRHGKGAWTVELARREAIRQLGLIRDGKDPAKERDDARKAPDFATFAARYLAEYAEDHKKPRTVREDRRQLDKDILPVIGGTKIRKITKADIARLHHAMRDRPVAANRVVALISSIFGWGERIGDLPEGTNPCKGIKFYAEKNRERYLSADEMGRLGDALAVAEAAESEDWRAIAAIRLLLLTGARKSEILSLEWAWIDADRGVARLPDSKTGARTIFLPPAALEILARLPRLDGSKYVLPGNRAGGHFIGLPHPWERLRAAAGLEDVHLHDLRHSFASTTITGGDSLFVLGKLLGHRKASTTEKYSHLAPDPAKAAADRAGSRIAALLGGTKEAEIIEIDPNRRRAG